MFGHRVSLGILWDLRYPPPVFSWLAIAFRIHLVGDRFWKPILTTQRCFGIFLKNTEKIFFCILDVYPPKFDRMKLLVHSPESYHQCASFGTLFVIKGFQKRLVFNRILKKYFSVFWMFTHHFLIVWPWNLDQTKATVNAHLFCFNAFFWK